MFSLNPPGRDRRIHAESTVSNRADNDPSQSLLLSQLIRRHDIAGRLANSLPIFSDLVLRKIPFYPYGSYISPAAVMYVGFHSTLSIHRAPAHAYRSFSRLSLRSPNPYPVLKIKCTPESVSTISLIWPGLSANVASCA